MRGRLTFDGGNENLVGHSLLGRGFFQVGDVQIFNWWGGTPPIPPVGKTLAVYTAMAFNIHSCMLLFPEVTIQSHSGK